MNLVIWSRSSQVSHSAVVRASIQHLEGYGFVSRWEDSKLFAELNDLKTSSFNAAVTFFYSFEGFFSSVNWTGSSYFLTVTPDITFAFLLVCVLCA